MAEKILILEQVSVASGSMLILDHIDFTIRRGEQWLLTGPSGSGKTALAHTLLGRHHHTGRLESTKLHIAIVEQQHRFKNLPGTTGLYYQQRFNSSDAGTTITVEEELREYASLAKEDTGTWTDELHIRPLLSRPLIQLSNGENKRVQLAIALSERPDLLILDNPFTGLDREGRDTLHRLIGLLVTKGVQILLIGSTDGIPAAITHIARLEKGRLVLACPREEFDSGAGSGEPGKELTGGALVAGISLDPVTLSRLIRPASSEFSVAVRMTDVFIRYGDAVLLKGVNWEVKKGERWHISGPNGAGKSTLLSLITADNPQAYANQIWLFDRRRGSGESIWDIKRKIGFVSPELHLYFDRGATCPEVIASGLFDTIGLFRPLNPDQQSAVQGWMDLLGIGELRHRRLAQLSLGQQRMVLLARALIKSPPMLILDEPCQGLDEEQTACFKSLVGTLCEAFGTTLIYVSHYQQEIPRCVDRFLRLENGAVVQA
jgi:molybdate transport system ATP-binding protein